MENILEEIQSSEQDNWSVLEKLGVKTPFDS
jgi:hypothetical protein